EGEHERGGEHPSHPAEPPSWHGHLSSLVRVAVAGADSTGRGAPGLHSPSVSTLPASDARRLVVGSAAEPPAQLSRPGTIRRAGASFAEASCWPAWPCQRR